MVKTLPVCVSLQKPDFPFHGFRVQQLERRFGSAWRRRLHGSEERTGPSSVTCRCRLRLSKITKSHNGISKGFGLPGAREYRRRFGILSKRIEVRSV